MYYINVYIYIIHIYIYTWNGCLWKVGLQQEASISKLRSPGIDSTLGKTTDSDNHGHGYAKPGLRAPITPQGLDSVAVIEASHDQLWNRCDNDQQLQMTGKIEDSGWWFGKWSKHMPCIPCFAPHGILVVFDQREALPATDVGQFGRWSAWRPWVFPSPWKSSGASAPWPWRWQVIFESVFAYSFGIGFIVLEFYEVPCRDY